MNSDLLHCIFPATGVGVVVVCAIVGVSVALVVVVVVRLCHSQRIKHAAGKEAVVCVVGGVK